MSNPLPQDTITYKRMTHKMHIKERPDTYLGCGFGIVSEPIWCATVDKDMNTYFTSGISNIPLSLVAVSKELFDNATDNVERSLTEGIDPGIINVTMSSNSLTICNFGKHISTLMHPEEGIPIPQLLFGELLTSDNYDDAIDRYKIGRNGYGSKLPNLFSLMFVIRLGDPVNHVQYTQTWTNGMDVVNIPQTEPYDGPGFTEITFFPNFSKLYANTGQPDDMPLVFISPMLELYRCRAAEMSYAAQVITTFNGEQLDYRDPMVFFRSHFKPFSPDMGILQWKSDDGRCEFIIADTPNKGWSHAFVNGTPVHQGEHVNEYLRAIFKFVINFFETKFKKKLILTGYRKHVSFLLRVTLNRPEFDGQIKRKLTKPAKIKTGVPATFGKSMMNWTMIGEIKKSLGIADKIKSSKLPSFKVGEVEHALQSDSRDPNQRLKCRLILTEGKTGKIIAQKATKFLPGGKDYNGVFPLRGVPMNVSRHNVDRVAANRELTSVLKILNADPSLDYYNQRKNCLSLRYGTIILMMDADPDGAHITGLMMNFVIEQLISLAPFNFIMMLHTPVIKGVKGNQEMSFYYQNQLNKWLEDEKNDRTGWQFSYKKGLGSWNTDDESLEKLFKDPVLIAMSLDEQSADMFHLAFSKECTDERKGWINGYDSKKEIVLTNPRSYTDFLNNDFLAYSYYAVIRSIPSMMDGLKPVQRKILYAMFKKFPSVSKNYKRPKMIQFGGYVMEKCGYDHGDTALYASMTGMGMDFPTGPNNIALVDGEGNYGDRLERGQDKSPGRYLFIKMAKITHYLYPKADFPLMEILFDDGEPVEPLEMYPVICMALVNRCEGIGTGWSTKIHPHNAFTIIDWTRQWVQEKKAKRDIPEDQLVIDVASKPELVPYYVNYNGTFVRTKVKPYEVYRNEGSFRMQYHTIVVTELPVEMSIKKYKAWGEKKVDQYLEAPDTPGVFRSFKYHAQPPVIDFHIDGFSTPTLDKLALTGPISMSNMMLLDTDRSPTKYNYTFEIMCAWCLKRLKVYYRRKDLITRQLEVKMKLAYLRYMFIMEFINGTIIVANRSRAQLIPEMIKRGYPYGAAKEREKKNKKKSAMVDTVEESNDKEIDTENPEENAMLTCNPEEAYDNTDFLAMPIRTLTREKAEKLKNKVDATRVEYEKFLLKLPEDLWLEDLAILEVQLRKHYAANNKVRKKTKQEPIMSNY
jgi:DNA topoisomerase-2